MKTVELHCSENGTLIGERCIGKPLLSHILCAHRDLLELTYWMNDFTTAGASYSHSDPKKFLNFLHKFCRLHL